MLRKNEKTAKIAAFALVAVLLIAAVEAQDYKVLGVE